ncbi:MAG: hypothetical protein WCG01_05065, partial [bacterium]
MKDIYKKIIITSVFSLLILAAIGRAIILMRSNYDSKTLNLKNNKSQTSVNFSVEAGQIAIQTGPLVKNKQASEIVSIDLPGTLYSPPKEIDKVSKSASNWKTPLEAMTADFSAFKSDDTDWILNDFIPEEQKALKEDFLNNKDLRKRSLDIFTKRKSRSILGEIYIEKYLIFIAKDSGQTEPQLYTFKETASGWKRTNALSNNESFSIITAAIY